MRFFFWVASRAFWVYVSIWDVRRVICSVSDSWTDLSCAIAVSEEVIGVSGLFDVLNFMV